MPANIGPRMPSISSPPPPALLSPKPDRAAKIQKSQLQPKVKMKNGHGLESRELPDVSLWFIASSSVAFADGRRLCASRRNTGAASTGIIIEGARNSSVTGSLHGAE